MSTDRLWYVLAAMVTSGWLYACWNLWGWFIRLHCGGGL